METQTHQGAAPTSQLLIVDDEEVITWALREYFGAQGFVVDVAQSLGEAKARVAGTTYTAVLSDLHLGDGDVRGGLDLLEYVRTRSDATPFVLLTAYGTREVQGYAAQLGVSAFLHKPQSLREVAQVMLRLIAERGTAQRTA